MAGFFVPLAALVAVLAKLSGEGLASMRGTQQPHADLAGLVPIIVLVLILWLLDRGRPTNRLVPCLPCCWPSSRWLLQA